MKECKVYHCKRKFYAKGYCKLHYNKLRATNRLYSKTPAEMVLEKGIDIKDNGCWIFQGNKNSWGYGSIRLNRKTLQAHRVIWEALKGKIPDGLQLCHVCDTPLCINPCHLFIGTQKTNQEDMAYKGRSCRGTKNYFARLNEDEVRAIRKDKRPYGVIAKEYGTSRGNVDMIKKRQTWKHI